MAATERSGEEDPVSARFLSRLCLAGTAIGLVGTATRRLLDPGFGLRWPIALTLMYLLFAELARRGRVQAAGVAIVLWTTFAALSVGLLNHELDQAMTYTALALFVGCTLLPIRTAVITGIGIDALVLLAALCPLAPANPRFYTFIATTLPGITALMLFAVYHRTRRERERRQQLEASERRLRARNSYLAFQQASLLQLTSSQAPDLAGAMRIVFRTASELLEMGWVGLALFDPDRGTYRFSHAHPERGLGLVLDPREGRDAFHAFAERRVLAVDEASGDDSADAEVVRRTLLQPLGLRRALLSPVQLDGSTVALLCIGDGSASAGHGDLLAPEQQASSLADLVSAFIAAERRHATERALAQAQKQEELALLMGGLAHDFNNVLSVIVVQTELLKLQLAGNLPLNGVAERIRAAALRAGGLVTNLLSFARPHGGHVEVVEVGAALATFAEFIKPLVGEDIELTVDRGAAPATVRIDRHQLEQIVINLATNARHAMPEGGRLLLRLDDVSYDAEDITRPTPAPGEYLRLTVSDTGAGIPEEILSRIWDPFFTTKQTGSGLGLATVQRIVQQAGGHVTVDSVVGRGTTFCLYLPADAPGVRPIARETSEPCHISGEHTVLVAEDDPALRELLEASFLQLGVRVVLVKDGQQAIDAFREHGGTFSAVILDVVMPRVGGADALRQIRQQRGDVRAILMSGYVPDASLSQIGGVSFLKKPFTFNALSHSLAALLADRPD